MYFPGVSKENCENRLPVTESQFVAGTSFLHLRTWCLDLNSSDDVLRVL
jgi:hypothetical protein